MIDITLPLNKKTLIFPSDPRPEITASRRISRGDPYDYSILKLGCHVGTHIDAPSHFVEKAETLADYDLATFVGPATVIDLRQYSRISRSILRSRLARGIDHGDRILIRTKNSRHLTKSKYKLDHVFFDPEAVDYLISRQPRCIGIDYYSLDDSRQDQLPNHLALARAGIPVIVALNLSKTPAGRYRMYCLPLLSIAVEGSPARVILEREG